MRVLCRYIIYYYYYMLHAQVYTQLVLIQYYIMLRKVLVFMDKQRWRRNNGGAILRLFTIYVSYLAKSFKRIAFDNATDMVIIIMLAVLKVGCFSHATL